MLPISAIRSEKLFAKLFKKRYAKTALLIGVFGQALVFSQSIIHKIDGGLSSALPPPAGYTVDKLFFGGNFRFSTKAINMSNPNLAPVEVYQSDRYGQQFSYTIANLTPGSTYSVRLHFAEIIHTTAGSRVFTVKINDLPVLENLDLVKLQGTHSKAISFTFLSKPNKDAMILIDFSRVIGEATVSGIDIIQEGPNSRYAPPKMGSVTDFSGITYQTVILGNQEWTAENIRTTQLRDGIGITHASTNSQWSTISSAAYCYFSGFTDPALQKKYGALYNGWAAASSKIAPPGWRVATESDWKKLSAYLIENGYNYNAGSTGHEFAKSIVNGNWWWGRTSPCGFANAPCSGENNNRSGFSAFPSGSRSESGVFSTFNIAAWWVPTFKSPGLIEYAIQDHQPGFIMSGFDQTSLRMGRSIRLVRDIVN